MHFHPRPAVEADGHAAISANWKPHCIASLLFSKLIADLNRHRLATCYYTLVSAMAKLLSDEKVAVLTHFLRCSSL